MEVDIEGKVARFRSGRQVTYDVLINTTPLDQFVFILTPRVGSLLDAASRLKHNGVFSVGLGFRKPCPSKKTWIYFPDDDCCFYRVTYFSNYSPHNVPDGEEYYSLMCETSYSEGKPRTKSQVMEETIAGLVATGLISPRDEGLIDTIHVAQADYAYPIPTLERDQALSLIQPYLEAKDIYSRGRFGAWKYELGNMDHSIVAGVEVIDRLLRVER